MTTHSHADDRRSRFVRLMGDLGLDAYGPSSFGFPDVDEVMAHPSGDCLLLVERNVGGSTPPYAVSLHTTLADAADASIVVALSFVLAAALGAIGGLAYVSWVIDQIDRAEEAMDL